MRSLRVKKKWVEDYNISKSLLEDLEVLFEFYKEGESNLEEVEIQYNKVYNLLDDIEFIWDGCGSGSVAIYYRK